MSFSNITVKQRNKETKALKTFLIYSFIISLVLHLGIIASILFKLLSKEAEVKEKPIEITLIDMPIQEETKPESEPEKPKLDTKEKPVEELKLNNQANSLNQQTRSINLENIPIPESTAKQQNIQQPPKRDNSNIKVSKKVEPSIPKASLQPQPSKKPNNQFLSTPIPTQKTTSEVQPKPNKPETSQSIAKKDTEAKKPRKTRIKKDKLERQRLRRALKKTPITQQSPVKKKDIEENVDTSLTEQPSLIQENNNETQPKKPRKTPRKKDKLERQRLRRALKKTPITQQSPIKKKDIEENVDTSLTEQPSLIQDSNKVDNQIPSEKPSPTDTNRKKPTKKAQRRRNRERIRNLRDSKVTEDKKSELVSDLKQAPSNSKLESVLEKPADSQTSQNTSEIDSNINNSNNNSINDTTNNPETNKIKTQSNITNPESGSTSQNAVTSSQSEDIKGNNNGNNDLDTNIEKPTSNSTPLATSEIPKVEDNSVSGSAKVSSDGRADCRKCNVVYPKWAERRKIQGRIVVAVDADAKGKVTSVRLVSSSGNKKLDSYHLKRAERWKLKPSENGRQGVTIGYEYILE